MRKAQLAYKSNMRMALAWPAGRNRLLAGRLKKSGEHLIHRTLRKKGFRPFKSFHNLEWSKAV
jgi:hypothetical protein